MIKRPPHVPFWSCTTQFPLLSCPTMNSGGRGQEGGSLCWFCLIANLSFDISPISQRELVRHAKPAPISARRMCALADMNSRRGGRPPHKTDIGKPAPTRPEELPNKNHLVGLRQARRTSRVGAECHGFNRWSFGKKRDAAGALLQRWHWRLRKGWHSLIRNGFRDLGHTRPNLAHSLL